MSTKRVVTDRSHGRPPLCAEDWRALISSQTFIFSKTEKKEKTGPESGIRERKDEEAASLEKGQSVGEAECDCMSEYEGESKLSRVD